MNQVRVLRPVEPGQGETALRRRRYRTVMSLREALESGGFGLEFVPQFIRDVFKLEAWRERLSELDTPIRAVDPVALFTAKPPEGIGATYEQLRDLCKRDPEAEALIIKVMGPELAPNGVRKDNSSRCNTTAETKEPATARGTADYIRARLARDANPMISELSNAGIGKAADLLAAVDAGVMSYHAAAIEMGYRKRRTAFQNAMTAWTKMTVEERARFLDWATRYHEG